jgi:hypothetical protein
MRLISNKKGQVRVIEAFLASVLLLGCLTFIPAQTTQKNSADISLAWKAENVLLTLDSDGHLAGLVDNRDWSALGNSVESALPLTTWFNLTVYNKDQNVLNPYPISNGGAVSDKIVSYNYVCVSQSSNYSVYVLQLQLAVVD